MKSIQRVIEKVLKFGVLYASFGLIAVVSIQIFARFSLAQAPSWTEEASRFFFIYVICFAAGLAMKDNYYVYMDLFFDKLSAKWQSILLVIISLFVITLFGLMAIYSLQLIQIGHGEKSSSLEIKMSYVFVSMLIMSVSITYYALIQLKKDWKNFKL